MGTLRIEKVNQLPGTLTPSTMYMVLTANGVDIYISDDTGTSAHMASTGNPGIDPFLLMGAGNG